MWSWSDPQKKDPQPTAESPGWQTSGNDGGVVGPVALAIVTLTEKPLVISHGRQMIEFCFNSIEHNASIAR
jgi:hypothetical protein